MSEASELNVVNSHLQFPKVSLIEPASSRFIHIAAEIDRRPAFLPSSEGKRRLIAQCKQLCARLQKEPGVTSAVVFRALIIPPGRGELAKRRADRVHIARFDFSVLIESETDEAMDRVQSHSAYKEMIQAVAQAASYVHSIVATNTRRIGPVDHTHQGVFLFNYFFADSVAQNLAVWDYTAGWFAAETGLDNSTVLLPIEPSASKYSVINHCRWNRLRDILPSLIFKRSFHSYVLE